MSQLVRDLVQLRARLFNIGAITGEERALLQDAIEAIEQAKKTQAVLPPKHQPGHSIYFAGERDRERDWDPNQRGD